MPEPFLYEKLDSLSEAGFLRPMPDYIGTNLASGIVLREYQRQAFQNFVTYYENENLRRNKQVHTLFHMATGSGKTVIMAGCMLYLYTQGYRRFLFFVNQTSILEKTKLNFTDATSGKYLFADEIEYIGRKVRIKAVDNFSGISPWDDDIYISSSRQRKNCISISLSLRRIASRWQILKTTRLYSFLMKATM